MKNRIEEFQNDRMMKLIPWNELPTWMQHKEVRQYYRLLSERKTLLRRKRIFDVMLSGFLIVVLSPLMLLFALLIKMDSPGPVFFRQCRVTQYGKKFHMHKFRTMITDSKGNSLTSREDDRITRVGRFLRKYHLDELGQLFDVLDGNMTFVGTRPEIPEYVLRYTPEMRATLLLPAGITSLASIIYINEAAMIGENDQEEVYVKKILPEKMRINLEELPRLGICHDIGVLLCTAAAVLFGGR